MLISDVILQAQGGELSNLSLKDNTPENNAIIIQYINLGLIALYKKFNLATAEVVIELGRATTPSDDYTMISDTLYQLPDEAGTIVGAYEENGCEININVEDDVLSIFTPSWNTVQIPTATEGSFVSIIYTKNPTYITAETETLPLPTNLLIALLHYIGYRAHGSLDGSLNTENNSHLMRFNAECEEIKRLGTITADDLSSVGNLYWKGFV